jgi:arylsulfatase A-like enzyme
MFLRLNKIMAAIGAVLVALGIAYMLSIFVRRQFCSGPEPTRPNLLWIVIDDLKTDHLGVDGYPRKITPALDGFAHSGVRFRHCVTQSPWSLPSYASMFTSRYPYELVLGPEYLAHIRAETEIARSRDPARMPEMNDHWYVALPKDTPMLAEVLKERGFATAAWVNNAWLKPDTYGLERGFTEYHDGLADREPYTPADETVNQAAAWIGKHQDGRWFAFVHLMDLHRPYLSHPGYDFGPRGIDRYDAELAFTDAAIGRLLAELDRLGLAKRTVIVINSDHGEGIFEDDSAFVGHGGGVIPEIAFVPLMMRWPGGEKNRTVTALCRSLDIMPTVLELLGVAPPGEMRGRSLVAEAKAKSATSSEPAFTMALLKGPEQVSVIIQGKKSDELYQAVAIPAYGDAAAYTITAAGLQPDAPPEIAPQLVADLKKFIAQADHALAAAAPRTPPVLDEKTRAALKALGYLQGQ